MAKFIHDESGTLYEGFIFDGVGYAPGVECATLNGVNGNFFYIVIEGKPVEVYKGDVILKSEEGKFYRWNPKRVPNAYRLVSEEPKSFEERLPLWVKNELPEKLTERRVRSFLFNAGLTPHVNFMQQGTVKSVTTALLSLMRSVILNDDSELVATQNEMPYPPIPIEPKQVGPKEEEGKPLRDPDLVPGEKVKKLDIREALMTRPLLSQPLINEQTFQDLVTAWELPVEHSVLVTNPTYWVTFKLHRKDKGVREICCETSIRVSDNNICANTFMNWIKSHVKAAQDDLDWIEVIGWRTGGTPYEGTIVYEDAIVKRQLPRVRIKVLSGNEDTILTIETSVPYSDPASPQVQQWAQNWLKVNMRGTGFKVGRVQSQGLLLTDYITDLFIWGKKAVQVLIHKSTAFGRGEEVDEVIKNLSAAVESSTLDLKEKFTAWEKQEIASADSRLRLDYYK